MSKKKGRKKEFGLESDVIDKILDEHHANLDSFKVRIDEVTEKYDSLSNKYRDSMIESAIKETDVRNVGLFKKLINVEFNEEGNIEGLDEQISALKESDPYLFNQPTLKGVGPAPTVPEETPTVNPEMDAISQAFGLS